MNEGRWPLTAEGLASLQSTIAAAREPDWTLPSRPPLVAGVFAAFPRGLSGRGRAGESVWAGAAALREGRLVSTAAVTGRAGASYEPGLLALRCGRHLEAAVRGLRERPDVLLVNGAGRDHPRRAGLAVHLGWALDVPSVGVTDRPLLAEGAEAGATTGAWTSLRIGNGVVAASVRARTGVRPVVVHPGWRTDLETAVRLVLMTVERSRTPEPLRQARRVARESRAATR